ncbi:MAG: HDOD domain-containing protein [Deltaproteobacteria bacterium]|nr:HDOD domain-containing protein [Deltaproteobacteria bacterium]
MKATQAIKVFKISEPHKEAKQKDEREIDTGTLPEVEEILRGIKYFSVPSGVYVSDKENLDERIRRDLESRIDNIPQVSIDSMRLLRLLLNPESNLREIVSLVMTHPVLSAKILQAVNSVYFHLPEKVTSVGRAITLLGYNNVRSILFHDILKNTVANKSQAESERYLKTWIHSAVVSACAGLLSKRFFPNREYDIATAGLMHDIGKFYFMGLERQIGEKGQLENEFEERGLSSILEEDKIYGVNHAVVGSYIARHWKLPEFIVKGIEYHHYPSLYPPEKIPNPYVTQSFILCLADLLSKALGYEGESEKILAILPEYYERYGLDPELKGLVTPEILKGMEKAKATVQSYVKVT